MTAPPAQTAPAGDVPRGRLTRLTRLGLPTLGSILIRLTQLLVLVVFSNIAPESIRGTIIAGFGVISAAAVMTDSGAVNFLLTSPSDRIGRRVLAAVLGIHAGLALLGGALAFTICLLGFPDRIDGFTLWILASISATQIFDSLTKVSRAPILVRGSDGGYAMPDLVLTALKVPLLIAAWTTAHLEIVFALPLVSAIVLIWTLARTLPRLAPGGSYPRLLRNIMTFGLAGAASALYSQSPILLGAFFLPVPGLALLALVYRVIQPLEIVPATISQQLMPRLVKRAAPTLPIWASFAGLGLLLSIAVVAARPLIESVFASSLEPLMVFILVASSLPLKFGNYALSAVVMAHGGVRQRLLVTVVVGVVIAACVAALSTLLAERGAAMTTPLGELLLALGLTIVLARSKKSSGNLT